MAYNYEVNSYYLHDYSWTEAMTWEDGLNSIRDGKEAVKFWKELKTEPDALRQIGELLEENQTLRGIYISTIDPEDFADDSEFEGSLTAFFDGLKRNRTLETLDLRRSKVGDVGAALIADCLETNTGVQHVDLQESNVTDVGAKDLARMLETNKTLRYLFLEENLILTDGCVALAESVYDNKTLFALSLRANRCSRLKHHAVTDVLKLNNTLRILSWPYWENIDNASPDDKFFPEFDAYLDEAVEKNTSIVEINYRKTDKASFTIKKNKELEEGRILKLIEDNDNKVAWMRCKLMVVGQGRAGKSATVRSLIGEKFDPNLDSTVGASLTQTRTTANDATWNKLSQEHKVDYYTSAVGKVIGAATVGAVTPIKKTEIGESSYLKPNTEGSGSSRKKKTAPKPSPKKVNKEKTVEKKPVAKQEQTERKVATPKAEENSKKPDRNGPSWNREFEQDVAKKLNHKLIARAHAEGDTIEMTIWDYGGQRVFYALHHLFLTQYGVYVLVFDMREMIKDKKNALSYVTFWLNSIKLHADGAPILMVGTFLDMLTPEEVATVEEEMANTVGDNFPQIVKTPRDTVFFPLSNLKGSGIDLIRQTIDSVAKKQEFLYRKIAVKWIRWLDAVQSRSKKKGKVSDEPDADVENYITWGEALTLAQENGINDLHSFNSMLELFHELGIIIHFTATQALKDKITLSPQWLIDNITKVIRDPELHQFEDEKIEEVGLTNDVKELFSNALASRDLLEYVWGEEFSQFFVELMRRTLLMSDYAFLKDGDEQMFLIPSMLPDTDEGKVKDRKNRDKSGKKKIDEKKGKTKGGQKEDKTKDSKKNPKKKIPEEEHEFVVDFAESWLPNGVYQRLVCLLVLRNAKDKGDVEPLLFQRYCALSFGELGDIELKHEGDSISVSVTRRDKAPDLLRMTRSMLEKINHDTMKDRLQWEIMYRDTDSKLVTQKVAEKKKLAPWFDGQAAKAKEKQEKAMNFNLENFLTSL
mmetsp:Transcript_11683/g.13550  ORF Transcript_11683/g.13550 Transcript_11683/m.13550 type:complete len:985 (+) Transcript_11683:161-3115(+)